MSHVLLDPMKNRAVSTPSTNARIVLYGAMVLVAIYGLLMSATTLAVQTIVESEDPGRSNLTLSEEPLVRIGVLEGPMEYMFGEITGAIRARRRERSCGGRAELRSSDVRR